MKRSVLGYVVLIGVVFGGALMPADGMMIFGDDIHRQYYFFRQFFNGWIGKGIFPWWNPYLFGGEPFIANPVVNIWYPLNWLFITFPLNIAYSWHLAFHVFWAMLGMYALTRTINNSQLTVNRSKQGLDKDWGAWVSGVIFGLSGFFMARTFAGHADVIAAASWMPWVVAVFYRLLCTVSPAYSRVLPSVLHPISTRRPPDHGFDTGSLLPAFMPHDFSKIIGSIRGLLRAVGSLPTLVTRVFKLPARETVIASGVFALQLISGYQTMAFFTVIAVGIMTLVYSVLTRSVRPLFRAGLAGIAGVGLAAFHLLPEQELFRASIRTYSFPYSWHSYGAIEWASLLQLINPFRFGNQLTYNGPPPNFIEHSMFVGIGGLVLVIFGVIRLFYSAGPAARSMSRQYSSHTSRSGTKPTVFSRRFSLQGIAKGSLIEQTFAMINTLFMRVYPGRIRMTVGKPSSRATRGDNVYILAVSFVLIAFFGIWVSLGPNAPVDLQYLLWKYVPMYHYLRIPARHLILVVFGLAGLAGIGFSFLDMSLKSLKFLKILIVGILIAEMVIFGRNFIELKPVPESRHDTELIALLKQDTEPYRVLQNFGAWVQPRDVLDFDSVMSYGIYSATGYDPSILRSYYDYIARGNGLAGERAVLDSDVQVPYFSAGGAGTLDFLNIKYIIVPPEYDPFAGNPRYKLLLDDYGNNYRLYENATVLSRFYLNNRSCGQPTVTLYTPNRIALTLDSTCDATLISSEVWYPGWTAYIDGKKTDITKTNDAFRTLFVSIGNHTIIYQYTPWIFYYGLGISSICAIALFVWVKKPGSRIR